MKQPFVFVCVLVFGIGCGKDTALNTMRESTQISQTSTYAYAPLAKPTFLDTLQHAAVVKATVTHNGVPVQDVELAFARSIAGGVPDYRWARQTNADGYAEVEITTAPISQLWPLLPSAIDLGQLDRNGATGYYLAKATDPVSGDLVGNWHSIFINGGMETVLSLHVGEPFLVLSQEFLLNFEDQAYEVKTINGNPISISEQDPNNSNIPLEIRLTGYNPFTPISGQVRFNKLGWIDITRIYRKDRFFVSTDGLLGPVEAIFFENLTITKQNIIGRFIHSGGSIDANYSVFTADIADGQLNLIGGIK